jgi:hypothetical protein
MTNTANQNNPGLDVGAYGFTMIPILETRRIRVFTAENFTLDNPDLPLNIRNDDCTLILFYGRNTESFQLGQIFAIVANDTTGPVYGSVNVELNDQLMSSFTKVAGDLTHPQHRFALRGYPTIMVYRNRRPVGIYNGLYDTSVFRMFVSTQACTATWNEPVTLAAGVASDNNVTYQRPNSYYDIPGQPPVIKRTSAELTPNDARRIGGTTQGAGATQGTQASSGPRVAPA